MPKIITFTANLLAETTYEFDAWREGKTQRARSESFQVGGKGINVSKMLNWLGARNAALCFPGGVFGPPCERWMAEKGIATMPFRDGCVTRSGSVVRGAEQEETTFLGVDSAISAEAVEAMIDALDAIEEPFLLAICGSIPEWGGARWEPFRAWIAARPDQATLVVDSYGACLPFLAAQRPAIVKFNRDELETLFDPQMRHRETGDLLARAAELFPVARWVVTDGGNPVWLKDGASKPESFAPPPVKLVSPTGCGDVFFATLLDCLYNKDGYDLRAAAERAADYASRSAAMPGIAEFEL